MRESSVSRTPVEIWSHILKLATQTWYEVYDTESIVEDWCLFDSTCAPYRQLEAAERIRKSLQLVCSSWNEVLKGSKGYYITDPDKVTMPPIVASRLAFRVQVSSDIHCMCEQETCTIKKKWKQTIPAATYSMPLSSDTQVLLALSGLKQVRRVLENKEISLKVLLWNGDDLSSPQLPGLLHLRTFQTITHLHLKCLRDRGLNNIDRDVFIPELRVLWLSLLSQGHDDVLSNPIFSSWKTPKLQRVRMNGYCSAVMGEDLTRFLSIHAPSITDLVLDVKTSGIFNDPLYWKVMTRLWSALPRLSLLGSSLNNLCLDAPSLDRLSTNTTKPFELLLINFPFIFIRGTMKSFQAIPSYWNADRILVEISWDDIKFRIRTYDPYPPHHRVVLLKRTVEFLDLMKASNVPFCDAQRVSLSEPEGQSFHAWLYEALDEEKCRV